jgi:S1-C subfamily serine protease
MQFCIKYFIPGCVAGIIAMIAHSKSVFLNFQGGKSAATGCGTLAAMNPFAGLCIFAVFISTTLIGRYVSVGSMMAALSGPFLMYYFTHGQISFVIYNIIGSSYVIIRHQSNIKRLLAGTEPKLGEKPKEKPPEPPEPPQSSSPDRNVGAFIILLALALQPWHASEAAAPQAKNAQIKLAAKSNISGKKDKDSSNATPGEVFVTATPAPITPEEANNIRLYKTDSPAVVNVTSSKVTPEMVMFGIAPSSSDTGSGSIISPDGYVLTNYHVIKGASMVRVTLFDGTPFMATVVGVDPQNDLAVLKIDAGSRKLSTIKFGDSSKLEVGRHIYTIGNPFGLDLTMTSGIISSVGRTLTTEAGHVIKGVLQTDAAINPGNSGGPLLDNQGNMIGVTTAIVGKQSAGLGFAIPINVVKRIVPELIAHGAVLRPDTGILQVRPVPGVGLAIVTMIPNGPAAQAGLKGPMVRTGHAGGFDFTQVDNSTADVIVGVDNQKVTTVDDLLSYIETKKPGQVVTLNVLRQGQREVQGIPVKLAETKPPQS